MKKLKLIGFVAALAVASPAAARPPMDGGSGGPARTRDLIGALVRPDTVMRNQTEIDLSTEQRDQIRKAMRTARNEIDDIRWDLEERSDKLKKVLATRPIDEQAALSGMNAMLALEGKMKSSNLALLINITNTLTADQVEKLRQVQASERKGRSRGRLGKPGRGGPPMRGEGPRPPLPPSD